MNGQTKNINAFTTDIQRNKGYLYTTNPSLSSITTNRRLTDATLKMLDFHKKRVLDVGCGDGTYTIEIFDRAEPEIMHGIDTTQESIALAKEKADYRKITFRVSLTDKFPYEDNYFDIVHMRGVLHHSDNPFRLLSEALRVAPQIIVLEPNGYNVVLKILERCSKYHIQHKERSFTPYRLNKWVGTLNAKVGSKKYSRIIPYFFPDALVKVFQVPEPFIEKTPGLNCFFCGTYMFTARRNL